MAALALETGRPVQSDGSFLVTTPEYYSVAALMEHDQRYFHPQNRNYIRRYLIKKPLGLALLLGSSHYNGSKEPLKCVEKDLQAMGEVLREGGWEVNTRYGPNTEMDDYREVMRQMDGKDMKGYSCFMFYFSGHGSPEGMLLQPNGDVVQFEEVIDAVMRFNDLRGKPKILIFDCCRGSGEDCSVGSKFKSLGPQFASKYQDMVVCYACTNNATSVAAHDNGSIFTQNFVKKMRQFGRELSFVDLLSQVTGETYYVVREKFNMEQHPVSHCGLNAQLLLKETVLSNDKDRELAGHVQFPIVLVPLDCQPESKGPLNTGQEALPQNSHVSPSPQATPSSQVATPMDTSQHEPVMRDHVTTATRFSTKRDVVSNIRTLGQGQHVFLCYLPDPLSPYGPSDPERVGKNLNCIIRLHDDLTQHGFVVTSDLSLMDQRPLNPLQWYVRHIERCGHVILVCCPAFKELFTSTPTRPVTDARANHFLCYSSAIYAERERCIKRGVSKFIPVVLEPEWLDFDRSVPLLFRGSELQLCERHPRRFDYDNKEGHFERLVCGMAGINRAKIDAPQPGAPMSFTSTPTVEEANRQKHLAHAYLPRDGYFTAQSTVGRPTSEHSTREQAWANVPLTTQYNRSTYQTPPPIQTSAGDMSSHGVQSGYWSTYTGETPTASLTSTAGLPSTEDITPPHSQRHYVATQYTATPSQHPPPHHLPPPITPTPDPAPTPVVPHSNPALLSLPLTSPPTPLLLWLSEHVVQWKFLGRYLDIEESTIARLMQEHQNDIREQCFQMLKVFVQQQGTDATCRKLGEALLQSEKNKQLFGKFCDRLGELSTQ